MHVYTHVCAHTPPSSFPQFCFTFLIAPLLSQMILTEFLLYFASHVLPCERPALSHPNRDPHLPTEPGMEAGGDADGKASGLTVAGGPRRACPLPAPPSLSCCTFMPCSSPEIPRKGSSSVKPEHAQASHGSGGIFLPTRHLTFARPFLLRRLCWDRDESFADGATLGGFCSSPNSFETASPSHVHPAPCAVFGLPAPSARKRGTRAEPRGSASCGPRGTGQTPQNCRWHARQIGQAPVCPAGFPCGLLAGKATKALFLTLRSAENCFRFYGANTVNK